MSVAQPFEGQSVIFTLRTEREWYALGTDRFLIAEWVDSSTCNLRTYDYNDVSFSHSGEENIVTDEAGNFEVTMNMICLPDRDITLDCKHPDFEEFMEKLGEKLEDLFF